MKKVIAALLLAAFLCGCGSAAQKADNVSSTAAPAATADTASSDPDKNTSKDIGTQSSAQTVSSKKTSDSDKAASSKAASSKAASSKAASSKAASSKSASSKSVSSKTASTNSASTTTQTAQPATEYTYEYDVGNPSDPIRSVAPEKVQQYIIEEPTIVVEPEPEAVFVDDFHEAKKVEDSWFDDCVFIGDSLSYGLGMYNDAYQVFGDADFVCASSLSYWNSQWDLYRPGNVHPYYRGQRVLAEDAVNLTGANKAIICLGMNDIGIWGPAGTIEQARSLLARIKAKSPNVKIYLETVSPMIYYAQKTHLNNSLIRDFNSRLEQFCAEEGYGFLNSYDALADNYGNLPYDFCSDPGGLGLHLKFNGCAVWTDFLKASVATAYPGDEYIESDSEVQSEEPQTDENPSEPSTEYTDIEEPSAPNDDEQSDAGVTE